MNLFHPSKPLKFFNSNTALRTCEAILYSYLAMGPPTWNDSGQESRKCEVLTNRTCGWCILPEAPTPVNKSGILVNTFPQSSSSESSTSTHVITSKLLGGKIGKKYVLYHFSSWSNFVLWGIFSGKKHQKMSNPIWYRYHNIVIMPNNYNTVTLQN